MTSSPGSHPASIAAPGEVLVFGPAYLDRVLRVDRPLIDPSQGGPIDSSVGGRQISVGPGLSIEDPSGSTIRVDVPESWPGPRGVVRIDRPLWPTEAPFRREIRGTSWSDDLGGMGAGFAAALGGMLVSAVGPDDDTGSQVILGLLDRFGVAHRMVRVVGITADWTLLVSSGPFGDKLPIGFRGCLSSLESFPEHCWSIPHDILVVAGLPNRLAGPVLRSSPARIRLFAPAMRNMIDGSAADFADAIDILCCNRTEWEANPRRDEVAGTIPLLAITEGPLGGWIRYRHLGGGDATFRFPAFPRSQPPRDTNRAGEAFASTLVATFWRGGWRGGSVEATAVAEAALRASAAASLVLDRESFGFPSLSEIDEAVRFGRDAWEEARRGHTQGGGDSIQ